MMSSSRIAVSLCVLACAAGCASTQVTNLQTYEGPRLARPDRIIVHDFAATAADLPAYAGAAGVAQPSAPPSPEALETGRKLGAQVAKELVAEIQAMGLPAVQSAGQPPARVGDIVLIGYFVSVDKGSAAERVVLGFGSGAADLKTMVEGYQMTDGGLRPLGSGEVDSGGGKSPGLIVPIAVAAATANPIGLVVGGALKVGAEASGVDTIEGAAKRTAKEIGDQLRVGFQKQGWI